MLPSIAIAQELLIRLNTSVSTRSSKPADPVEAVVIAPVMVNGHIAIAPGTLVHGSIEKVVQSAAPNERAALLLRFTALESSGKRSVIAAAVASVDNARENVDETGQINGILATETLTGQLDAGLDRLRTEYGGFASILSAAKNAVFREPSTDISLPARRGDGFTASPSPYPCHPSITRLPAWPAKVRHTLTQIVADEPFRTEAQSPPRPSDLTNLLLVGTEDALRRAFHDAGWSLAAGLTPQSKFETLRALAEDHAYSEAPVSVLLLAGKPPDLVFEKSNNTFKRRHHLRIWRRPGKVGGKPIWAVAATHDIGIDLSEADRTLIHRIDPRIDTEREKVVNDLLFTGQAGALDLFERPAVPHQTFNATGDRIETDGRIAILRFD